MKSVDLTFPERIKLVNVLDSATGTLGKIHVLGDIYSDVKFSDEEIAKMTIVDRGGGIMSYTPPAGVKDFGAATLTIEDQSAKVLLMELEAFQGCRISDVPIIESIKTKIEAAPAEKPATDKIRKVK
jgi:hypothetical protein